MNKQIRKTITLLLVSLISLSLLPARLLADNTKTISVRADEWYPFNGQPKSKMPGYIIEIASYAFNKHGYLLDYQLMPWERSIEETITGNADCIVGAYKSDVPNFIFPKNNLGIDYVAFYGMKENSGWVYQTPASLDSKTIAVIGGYSYGEEIDAYIIKNKKNVHIATGDEALERNIKMLLSKRVDLILESPMVFEHKRKTMKEVRQIKEISRRNVQEKVYIACNPANKNAKHYVQMLDQGLAELRQSGELEKILKKYGLDDWNKTKTKDVKNKSKTR